MTQKKVDLAKADVIVGVGRGVKKQENMAAIRDLAEVLGAEIGASRPVVDSEWLERDRQIGSSGQTVAPKLYIAAGISGAIQHVVGIKNSGCIVAINSDQNAPIFNVATYGIVGDLMEVVPALAKRLKAEKGF
jgi:electron transfer flavoprotein alpha subunit